ncbi:MAG TPA: hypothetical protein VMN38_02045 [Sphingomicrobium sp.]|nr:hypothetical protein [Sphingomicrobium sp.]
MPRELGRKRENSSRRATFDPLEPARVAEIFVPAMGNMLLGHAPRHYMADHSKMIGG